MTTSFYAYVLYLVERGTFWNGIGYGPFTEAKLYESEADAIVSLDKGEVAVAVSAHLPEGFPENDQPALASRMVEV